MATNKTPCDPGPTVWAGALALVGAVHLGAGWWLTGGAIDGRAPAPLVIAQVSLVAPRIAEMPGGTEPHPAGPSVPEETAPAAEPGPPLEPEPPPEPEPLSKPQAPAERESARKPSVVPMPKPKPATTPKPRAAPAQRPARRGGAGKGVPHPSPLPATAGNAATTAGGGLGEGPSLAPRHDAAYLRNPAPAYPAAARRRGLGGKVVIRAQVSASGECVNADVSRSSGHRLLDEAALAAVRRWRFVPASRGGRDVPAAVEIPIVFRLQD